ncbi:DNA internalization-related competence protein ComEC/Rec2 [Collinsella tanakaei]|nr:DNA internalization-related competence protein ComEC/Rec2 [Collinsella tanakaei]
MRVGAAPADAGLLPRPYVPPLCAGAASACAVCALLLDRAWANRCAGAEVWLPITVVAGAVAVGATLVVLSATPFARRADYARAALFWAGILCIASSLSSAIWIQGLQRDGTSFAGSASRYRYEVCSDASHGAFGVLFTAEAYDVEGRRACRVRVTAQEAFAAGDVLSLVGRIEPLDYSEWGRSRFMRGEVALVRAVRVTDAVSGGFDPVRALRQAAVDAIDPARSAARALVAGTVCGSVTDLNQTDASDVFSATGLSHLVAVSGSHLALISAFVSKLLDRIGCSRTARFAVVGALSVAYVLFTGCAPSAVRSAIMVCLAMTAQGAGRRGHGISALALAVCGFVLMWPGVVFDLGFQLSAMSVLFISLFGTYVAHLLRRAGLPRALSDPLSLTLVAQWATLPLTLPVFGELSLVAPAANLVVGPLMSALLVCGLALVWPCIAFPPLCALMAIPEALANISIFAAELLASVPFASIRVSAEGPMMAIPYAVAAAVYVRWPDPKRWQLLVGASLAAGSCGCWFAYWQVFAPPAITVLDVGQADSILVRDGSQTLLVDAGVDEATAEALARNHVLQLDAVLITHWDQDHWGGLPDVLATVEVDRILVARGAAARVPSELLDLLPCACTELSAGDRISVGGYTCDVVWPRAEVAGEENADSVVLDVSYAGPAGSYSMLLTGDTEVDQELAYADAVGTVDILKLGHHGSAASVDGEVLDLLDPSVAVASAGKDNAYGHPDPACVQAVERHGAAFACTKDAGDLVVEPHDGGFRVRAQGVSG